MRKIRRLVLNILIFKFVVTFLCANVYGTKYVRFKHLQTDQITRVAVSFKTTNSVGTSDEQIHFTPLTLLTGNQYFTQLDSIEIQVKSLANDGNHLTRPKLEVSFAINKKGLPSFGDAKAKKSPTRRKFERKDGDSYAIRIELEFNANVDLNLAYSMPFLQQQQCPIASLRPLDIPIDFEHDGTTQIKVNFSNLNEHTTRNREAIFSPEWYVTDEAYSTIHFTLHSANFCILFLARLLFKTERNFTEASVAHFIRTNPFGYNEFPLILRGCLSAYEEEKTKINQGSEEKLRQGQMAEFDRKQLEQSINQFLQTCLHLESEFVAKNLSPSANEQRLHSTFNHVLSVSFGRALLLNFLRAARKKAELVKILNLPKYLRILKRFDSELWLSENRNEIEAAMNEIMLETTESGQKSQNIFDRIDVDTSDQNLFANFDMDNEGDNKLLHFFFTKSNIQNETTVDNVQFLIERYCEYVAQKQSKISFLRFCYDSKNQTYACDFFKQRVDDAFANIIFQINFDENDEQIDAIDELNVKVDKKSKRMQLWTRKLLLLYEKSEEVLHEILVLMLIIKLLNIGEYDPLAQGIGKSSKRLEKLVRKNVDIRISAILSADDFISSESASLQHKFLRILQNVDFEIFLVERLEYKKLPSSDAESVLAIPPNPNRAVQENQSRKKTWASSSSLEWDKPFTNTTQNKPWKLYTKSNSTVSGKKKEVLHGGKAKEQQKGPKAPKKERDVSDQSSTGRKQSNKFRVKNRRLLKDEHSSDDEYAVAISSSDDDDYKNKSAKNSKRKSNPSMGNVLAQPFKEKKNVDGIEMGELLLRTNEEVRQEEGEATTKAESSFASSIANNKVGLTHLVYDLVCRPNWDKLSATSFTAFHSSSTSLDDQLKNIKLTEKSRATITERFFAHYGSSFKTFLEVINKKLLSDHKFLEEIKVHLLLSETNEALLMEFLALVQLWELLIVNQQSTNSDFTTPQKIVMLRIPISFTILNKLAHKSEKNRLYWTEENVNMRLMNKICSAAETLNKVFNGRIEDIWAELLDFERKIETGGVESQMDYVKYVLPMYYKEWHYLNATCPRLIVHSLDTASISLILMLGFFQQNYLNDKSHEQIVLEESSTKSGQSASGDESFLSQAYNVLHTAIDRAFAASNEMHQRRRINNLSNRVTEFLARMIKMRTMLTELLKQEIEIDAISEVALKL